ncbi:20178_t:CDS:2, partial [Gigaspora margarita]
MTLIVKNNLTSNKFPGSQPLEVINIFAKSKIKKNKEGRPRIPICNDYDKGEEDGHGHFEASYHYCDNEECHTWLQVPKLESMAQIYSFYVSNIKQELNFYDKNFKEAEFHSSVVNETVFAEVVGANNKEEITLIDEEQTTIEFD